MVKEHDERKNEFLDTAMRLFLSQGYEQTSVNAIIKAVGVSKGAFYHYFATKEDLLDELSRRASAQVAAIVDEIVADPEPDAIAKLNLVFSSTNSFKAQNLELMSALAQVFYSDSNVLLRERMSRGSVAAMAPRIGRIIEQGNAEGVMSVRHPEATARFVLTIGSGMVGEFAKEMPIVARAASGAGADREAAVGRIVQTLEIYTESVERILGIEPGRLRLVDEAMIRLIRGVNDDNS